MQAYSDPSRESDPYALPDLEVWEERTYRSDCCGTDIPAGFALEEQICPTCDKDCAYSEIEPAREGISPGFWYWYCFPGCIPDSDPFGPFDTESAALADARENAID